ncbi:sensor histidine kinase [Aquimarina agarivorans]|uniref:sensor histidine kinase n=1 Tax=Aquimarina agarivorans TaxID=980584 RepID=UPI0003153181|nr:histidine kinase [Aquimarina agarivorans]
MINILIIIGFVLAKELIEDTFFQNLGNRRLSNGNESGPPLPMSIYIQLLKYIAPLLFAIAIKTTKRWAKNEAAQKEAANIKLQSELQHLHYQLQPHFFFNSLNNIYSLVDISPDQAKTSIHGLSKLMRYMLYETNVELVPLSKEIEFMKKYIDLMKLRLSDKTIVHYNFPNKETDIKIAPLLFISLIENAFKHGVSATKESEICIEMSVDGGTVNFTTKNGNFPKKTDDKSGSGIGIPNIKKRLDLLYPNKNSFHTEVENNLFTTQLTIETT